MTTAMETARRIFLAKSNLDECSIKILNEAKDLSTLSIEVEAPNTVERGIFVYNSKSNKFCLFEPDHFCSENTNPCNYTGECYKENYNTCVRKYIGRSVHPFMRFLKLCYEGIYNVVRIEKNNS